MTDKSSLLGTAINKSLGGFADGLRKTNFGINDSLRQLFPEVWTGLKLKRDQRRKIMEGYEIPNNYLMDVKESDGSLLKGWNYRTDLALKKAQLRIRDVLVINMHLMEELDKPEPDVDICYKMALEATMMSVHHAGATQGERLENVNKSFKVGSKRPADSISITDDVNLKEMVKRRKLEKDLEALQRPPPRNNFNSGGRNFGFRGRGRGRGRGGFRGRGRHYNQNFSQNFNNNDKKFVNNKNDTKYFVLGPEPIFADSLPISDRLRSCIHAWHEIKANKYIIHLLCKGIDLDFVSYPTPNVPMSCYAVNEVEHAALLKQFGRLRGLKCVRKLFPQELDSAVFAPTFVRPKKGSSDFRMI